ncbi:MAG: hypothetical protein LAP39_21655 [Acidobacteriia bacterium]|nr:hypothetical protein [Terriglobia bacterium]
MKHTIRPFSKAIVLLLAALLYLLSCLVQIDPRQISLIEEGKKRAPPSATGRSPPTQIETLDSDICSEYSLLSKAA